MTNKTKIPLIPHSRPFVGEREKKAVNEVIGSLQLAEGEQVIALEKELSCFVGHKYGVAVSSGTAAIYLTLKALGVKKGDAVIIPSYVCTALLNAVLHAGAVPVLCDVDPVTGNMGVENVKKVLRKKIVAIIVPHMFGNPADVTGIAALGAPVIEDCAQCVGATTGERPSGGMSQASIFSFYANKLIAAGEGGMVATSDQKIAQKIIESREYDNRKKYTQSFNFKLSDVHAAIARQQLEKLPMMIKKRRSTARRYCDAFSGMTPMIKTPVEEKGINPVYFRFVVQVASGQMRDAIIKKMDQAGIACRRPVFKPLHQYLNKSGFPGTEEIYQKAISLPVWPGLTREQVNRVCDCFAHAIGF
jgi:Predicted pyridoxal phosphate-dependent enzyme apparently involved in regulation of cell wall biogenesis